MFEMFADLMRDRFASDVYLGFALAVMVLPMVALAYWYHANVSKTQGGRNLMADNENYRSSGRMGPSTGRNLTGAAGMVSKINSGHYGDNVRRLQYKTYWYVLYWIVANVIVFGALIWAVNYNQSRDAAAQKPISTQETSTPAPN